MFLAAALLATPGSANAQTDYSTPVSGGDGGTLKWAVTVTNGTCGGGGTYQLYNYSNFIYDFSFVSPVTGTSIPVSINLGGSAGYIANSPGAPYCPPNGAQPSSGALLSDSNGFFRAAFSPSGSGYGTVAMEGFSIGAMFPKYQVLSVIYAPPSGAGCNAQGLSGNQSYVDYTNTTAVGTSTTFGNSFTQSSVFTQTASLLFLKATLAYGYTQETDSTSSVSVNQTSSISDEYPGSYPACATIGLNHDNDIILLWVNPALDCMAEGPWSFNTAFGNAVECLEDDPNGAPGDPDDPLMDIEQIPAGWLNGHYPFNSDVLSILNKHGITSSDYSTILAADPWGNCAASITCAQNASLLSSSRFQLASDAGIIEFEPLGNTTQYSPSYSQTSAETEAGSNSYSVSYTLNATQGFKDILSATLQQQNTLTLTNKWSTTTTGMVGHSVTVSVTGPSPSSGYSGPTQFKVYQDNVYGTFVLYPTQ